MHKFPMVSSEMFRYFWSRPKLYIRISAQIISGISFLGAGIILKSEIDKKITNLTTAAAIWFAASIGMAMAMNTIF
jgi:putative Mg2+ transporter-C (MgtC) family protein